MEANIFCALLVALAAPICAQIAPPRNPCPRIFEYKQERGRHYGEITVPSDGTGIFVLEVNVSIAGYYKNVQLTLTQLVPYDDLYEGAYPRYRVDFPFQHTLPKITQVRFNNRILCSGPPEPLLPGRSVTSLWSKISLNLTNGNPLPIRHPPYTSPVTSTTTTTTPSSSSYSSYTDPLIDIRISGSKCGIANDVQSLVVNGAPAAEGEFPWLGALLYRRNMNYEFRCTVNLISDAHVLTAAHCVQLFRAPLIPREDMLIVLGKSNIQNWANGKSVLRDVEKVAVHPSYEQNTGNYDVAVIKLSANVEFSRNVKPVCLWEGSSSLSDILHASGTVAGWGRDETGADYVKEPRKVALPVVSQEDCLRSDKAFFNLTSDKTFCAGSRDGKGPCTGDSGAGFMMQKNSKWMLRGVVSVAIADPLTRSCDTTKYFVFTDVGKLVDWLKSVMKQ